MSEPINDPISKPAAASREDAAPEDRRPDVTIERGGVGALQAGEVSVSIGGIGAVRADRVSVELGGIGVVAAREVQLGPGSAGMILAQDVRIGQSIVRSVVAREVTLNRGAMVGIVLAGRVNGDGRALVDGRAAVVAGTIFALAWLILRRLR